MPHIFLIAMPELRAEFVIALLFTSVIYLGLATIVTLISRSNSLRFVGLGLVTSVAGVAYASLVPPAIVVAPTMMKMGFLLVLGGILVPFWAGASREHSENSSHKTETQSSGSGSNGPVEEGDR